MKCPGCLLVSTIYYLILCLGLSVSHAAQAGNGATPLSLLEAYQLAQQHDAQIASALAARDASREKLPQGRAGLLPQVSLQGEYSNYHQDTRYKRLTPSLTSTENDFSYDSTGYSVSLTQDQRARLRRHYLGFVFQGFNLLDRTSALENVELPLIYRGISAAERHARASEALAVVGLQGWEHHTPGELSGGQQQRVAIARAIVTEPNVLLADEPTGNLDTTRSREIMELLSSFNQQRGITIIMVTHETYMAAYAQRTVKFVDGLIESDQRN